VDSPPNSYVPKPRYEYKRPSILAEHKYLAIFFVVLILAGLGYLISARHEPLKLPPPEAPPVYVDTIPQPAVPSTH
jgi:hypothetical protein